MHGDFASLGVSRGFERVQARLGQRILRVAFVVRPCEHSLAWCSKRAHIVHMLIGLVVIDAVRQPDHLGNAQIVTQRALDLGFGQIRVASRGEQARLSHKRGALAVHVDRATLADEIPLVIAVVFHQVAELARHAVVALPAGIQAVHRAAPGIEPPVDAATLALAVYHKGRPHVARPGVVGLHHDQTHLRRQLGAGVVILSF